VNARVIAVVGGLVILAAIGVVLLRPGATPPESSAGAADEASGGSTVVKRDGPAPPEPPPGASPVAPAREAGRAPRPTAPAPAVAPDAAEPAAVPVAGTLRIESDVAGAQVFLDRQFVGMTPVTAENVKPGSHQLNVSAEGFEGFAQTIEVEPGPRDISVRFREVRLDVRVPVVHKHRMGSCTGQLIATAQGVRYETSDADDRFAVGLGDIEALQVDYQDKNLRLKVRKGKQYNFTDPDGNADRLFVFHRDVDKVRQRLASGDGAAN
jgi:hypothetical protein